MGSDVSSYALLGALSIIMLGMGLGLTKSDFTNIYKNPRALAIGLFCQILLLPVIAFFIAKTSDVAIPAAIGLMILSACPGGAASNLIAHLAKADVALSVSLTTISTLLSIFTVPIIVNLSLKSFLGEQKALQESLDPLIFIFTVFCVILIPVSIGMMIRFKNQNIAEKALKLVKPLSAMLLAVIIIGILFKEKSQIAQYFAKAGSISILLNIITTAAGFLVSRLAKLNFRQSLSVTIETGFQNGTLAIYVAVSLLHNLEYAIVPAFYSITMFITAFALIMIGNKVVKN